MDTYDIMQETGEGPGHANSEEWQTETDIVEDDNDNNVGEPDASTVEI